MLFSFKEAHWNKPEGQAVLTGQLEMAHTAVLTFLSDSSVEKLCFLDDFIRAQQPCYSPVRFVIMYSAFKKNQNENIFPNVWILVKCWAWVVISKIVNSKELIGILLVRELILAILA